MNNVIPVENETSFRGYSFSHKTLVGPKEYQNCDFQNCDMNYTVFKDLLFDGCDFSQADISGATFEDCTFQNCYFRFANLSYSSFFGCHFIETEHRGIDHTNFDRFESAYANAGTSNTSFFASNKRRGLFQNVHFRDMGFRYSRFVDIDFQNTSTYCVPFECAQFENCSLDKLDTRVTNTRGTKIVNCKIGKFISLIEKTFSFVGVDFLFRCDQFELYVQSTSDSVFIEDIFSEDFQSVIQSALPSLKEHGALFEYVNAVILLKLLEKKSLEEIDSNFFIDNLDAFLGSANSGTVAIPNFINFVDTISHFKSISSHLMKVLYDMVPSMVDKSVNERQCAELYYKLQVLGEVSLDEKYVIRVSDISSTFAVEQRGDVARFVSLLLTNSQLAEALSISQRRGSVVEEVLVNAAQFIESFWQFSFILFLLGFKCKVKTKSGSLFVFSLFDSLKLDKKDSNTAVSAEENPQDKIDYVKDLKEQAKASGLKLDEVPESLENLKPDEQQLNELKAFVKERELEILIRKAKTKELVNVSKAENKLLSRQ